MLTDAFADERLLSRPGTLPSNLNVAQVGNLPFRRLAVGRPAGCQPATQQTTSLRYLAAASGYGAPGAQTVRGWGEEVPQQFLPVLSEKWFLQVDS